MVTIVLGSNSVAITVDDITKISGFNRPGTNMYNKGAIRAEIINGSINFWDKDTAERILTVDYRTVPTTVGGIALTDDNVIDTLDSLFRSQSSSGGGGGGDYVTTTQMQNALAQYLKLTGGKLTGNLDLADGCKLLFSETDENGVTSDYALIFVGDYANVVNPNTGEIIARWLQTEVGNTHIPINLSTANNPISGKYIAYDVGAWILDENGYPAMAKQILATFTEGVLRVDNKYFDPVDNGSGGLTLSGVTFTEIQEYYRKYQQGLTPVTNHVASFQVDRLTISNDIVYFEYHFTEFENGKLEYYSVSASGTEQNVISRVIKSEYILTPASKFGSIGTAGSYLDLPLGDSGLVVRVSNTDGTNGQISVYSTSGTITADARRVSIHNDSSEGGTEGVKDSVDFGTTPTPIDSTVYMASNDWNEIWVAIEEVWYICKIFLSGNGVRTRMLYTRVS